MRLSWLRRHDRQIALAGRRERETAASLAPSSPSSPSSARLSSTEVTALRVRALQGDPLREVRDATREWVLRSLLIGKHLDEWAALAGISEPHELEHALQQVRRWYQQRLESYQRARQ